MDSRLRGNDSFSSNWGCGAFISAHLLNGPQLWLNLQQKIDIWDAMTVDREQYEKVHAIV